MAAFKTIVIACEEAKKHWDENLDAAMKNEPFGYDGHDCSLCAIFSSDVCRDFEDDDECPIAWSTGPVGCNGTPWHEVDDAVRGGPGDLVEAVEDMRKCVHESIDDYYEMLKGNYGINVEELVDKIKTP